MKYLFSYGKRQHSNVAVWVNLVLILYLQFPHPNFTSLYFFSFFLLLLLLLFLSMQIIWEVSTFELWYMQALVQFPTHAHDFKQQKRKLLHFCTKCSLYLSLIIKGSYYFFDLVTNYKILWICYIGIWQK